MAIMVSFDIVFQAETLDGLEDFEGFWNTELDEDIEQTKTTSKGTPQPNDRSGSILQTLDRALSGNSPKKLANGNYMYAYGDFQWRRRIPDSFDFLGAIIRAKTRQNVDIYGVFHC